MHPIDDTSSQEKRGLARPWSECPCCRGVDHRLDFDFSDSTFPTAVPGRIVTCRCCGLQFKVPSRPEVPLEAYYADSSHYGCQDDVAEAEKEFAVILKAITCYAGSGASLLDLGCGAGHFLRVAVRGGFRASGVELNPDLARMAAESSGADVVAGDALALPELMAGREHSFMVVTLLDVIEHVRDPVQLLRAAASFVAPGGFLLVYTPNHSGLLVRTAAAIRTLSLGRATGPLRGIYDCDHITFFDPASLRETARRASLVPGPMTMVRYNPSRRSVTSRISGAVVRLIEAFSPWCFGEFRMLLLARPARDHPGST